MRANSMRFDRSIAKFINNLAPHEIPEGLCRCGCGTPTPVADQSESLRGYTRGKHYRYAFSHNRGISTSERFYERDTHTGCWLWQRSASGGYGTAVVTTNGVKRNWKAHILYFTLYKGEIPSGMVLDHKCRNTLCVNPDHLEPVTHVENVRRGKNTKITADIATQIRELHSKGQGGYRTLGRRFGISGPQVAKIVKHIAWA